MCKFANKLRRTNIVNEIFDILTSTEHPSVSPSTQGQQVLISGAGSKRRASKLEAGLRIRFTFMRIHPAFHFNADPYPDPAFQVNADPDPAPHQGYENLRPQAYRASRSPF